MRQPSIVLLSAVLSLFLPFAVGAQTPPTNHKPVLISRKPVTGVNLVPTNPLTFSVSASDPDGDTLTYIWKVNTLVKKVGADTSWVFYPSDLQPYITYVVCVFTDPGGLNDSTRWHIGPDLFVDPGLYPDRFHLSQNYPNPFNPSTTIRYHLPKAANVVLKVFNVLGAPITVLVEKNEAAGDHEIFWTANVPSGIYIYRLETSQSWDSRKMVLLK
jgi:hypothetical protein